MEEYCKIFVLVSGDDVDVVYTKQLVLALHDGTGISMDGPTGYAGWATAYPGVQV